MIESLTDMLTLRRFSLLNQFESCTFKYDFARFNVFITASLKNKKKEICLYFNTL